MPIELVKYSRICYNIFTTIPPHLYRQTRSDAGLFYLGVIFMGTKSFLRGMKDFYFGNKKETLYSNTPGELMTKAFKMTGKSLIKT